MNSKTRKPAWLIKKIDHSALSTLHNSLSGLGLNTICKEARCPNHSECARDRQASFLVLGTICTRRCTFCNVTKSIPLPPDPSEPYHIAQAVQRLLLTHVVITSPTRDDLPDGGAEHYSRTVMALRELTPHVKIELLVPDLQGSSDSLMIVINSLPDILSHNMETVRRLYSIRKGAVYSRSLDLFRTASSAAPGLRLKSGFMLGLGETKDEVLELMCDLYSAGCRLLSIGQYLRPSLAHQEVVSWITPREFEDYKDSALSMGFQHVESGPFVRSSYHSARYLED